MTQQAQAEALQQAEWIENTIMFKGEDGYVSPRMQRVAAELRSLHARVQELEADLVAEAARTAEQKLRADQMSLQHDTQAALNLEAREQLAMAMSAISGLQKRKDDWKLRANKAEAQQATAPARLVVTEEMHIAAAKVLHRSTGVDGLPQRMLDAMLAAAPTPPAQERVSYRLLVSEVDKIEVGDEFLSEDAETWAVDLHGIFVGMTYGGRVLRPARRAIERAHGIGATNADL